MEETRLQVTSTRADSSLSVSTRFSLIARGRRDADELSIRPSSLAPETNKTSTHEGICNKCGECGELVLDDCVCGSCCDRLDQEWAGVTVPDWVLVAPERPNQFNQIMSEVLVSRGKPPRPDGLYRYIFRNITYPQMKSQWAKCTSQTGLTVGTATSEDVAQMRLVCARSKRPDNPASDPDIAVGIFGGWPRSRLAFIRRANAEDIATYEQSKSAAERSRAEKAEWCRLLAENGDKWGQCELGYLYYTGWGVPKDYAAAVHWFRKAVEPGKPWDLKFNEALAHYDLGLMYHNGHGVAQDYAMAANYYRTAAELGNRDAQFNLGLMFQNGQGVPRDLVESHMWLELSLDRVSRDDDGRAYHLETVARMMTSQQIAEAQVRARDWKPVRAK